uniref:Uncharacterized protein n=1 Tax=Tanacetum cinerariifolium TaxID=118510 RepID=A0A6L2MJW7_TANCI|nr:hypothetical protein [Tanacetum cinerariifolium]
MIEKQNDLILKEENVNICPINYVELNKLSEHFVKHFVPQKQLSAEQAFWLSISKPMSEQLVVQPTPVNTEVTRELPNVSLVNKSFQKLKRHFTTFDKLIKHRTTALAITKGTWGFEHTKEVFQTEVIPFINSLRESLKDFDNGLHLEINEMKKVFHQMEAEVDQCSVDKKYVIANYKDMRKIFVDEYNENLELKAELSKKNEMVEKSVYNEVSNRCLRLEQRIDNDINSTVDACPDAMEM